jgi:hypothetical protein
MKKGEKKNKQAISYDDEIWKEIPGTGGVYQISNYGRLKSFRRDSKEGKIMKLAQVKGFRTANIKINGKYKSCLVHKLVAEAFIPKPSEQHTYITHIDDNIENNHVSNLKWITRSENYKKVIKHLEDANKNRPGKFAPYSKLSIEDVRHIKSMLHLGVKQKVIAKMFCVSEMQITRIKKGINWAEVDFDENIKTITFR